VVAEELADALGLRRDRPDAGDVGERPGRSQHPDRVAAGRPVDDDEVVAAALAVPALGLRELPRLGHRDELGGARRGPDEGAEEVRPRQDVGELREPRILASHSSRAWRGSIVVVHNASSTCTSSPGFPGSAPSRTGILDCPPTSQTMTRRVPSGWPRGQRSGHGRLADASLAGHEEQLAVVERHRGWQHRCGWSRERTGESCNGRTPGAAACSCGTTDVLLRDVAAAARRAPRGTGALRLRPAGPTSSSTARGAPPTRGETRGARRVGARPGRGPADPSLRPPVIAALVDAASATTCRSTS
jgi:hypothetical protein